MARYIHLRERTRPYRIAHSTTRDGWVVWDRRRFIGTSLAGLVVRPSSDSHAWLHPTHAAAIAALDAHLREQAATEPSA